MSDDDLGQMPTPTTEEPELEPGGVDALVERVRDDGMTRDLSPEENPAVDDALPDEVAEPDDKPQAPDEDQEEKAVVDDDESED